MGYTIADIAALITEEPDYCRSPTILLEDEWPEDLLLEARPETYINFFNKSTAPVQAVNPMQRMQSAQQQMAAGGRLTLPPIPMLKDLAPEQKLELIRRIQATVDPALGRYEQYFIRQVAAGFMPIDKINEDAERLNNTIKLFIKLSRKATWEGSKNILDFPNWRRLEQRVREHEDKHIDYDTSKESEVLYSKKYYNNAIALLLGGPPEVSIYWFRAITSRQAACKYGKGTTWCTSTSTDYDPNDSDSYPTNPHGRKQCSVSGCKAIGNDYNAHGKPICFAHHYLQEGGLYIVEVQTPTKPRRPIYQISGHNQMNPEDLPVTKYGPRFIDFIKDVLNAKGDQIHPKSVRMMEKMVASVDLTADDAWDDEEEEIDELDAGNGDEED